MVLFPGVANDSLALVPIDTFFTFFLLTSKLLLMASYGLLWPSNIHCSMDVFFFAGLRFFVFVSSSCSTF
jgi:hypothetical protein